MNRSAFVAGPTFVALGTVLLLDEAGRLRAWSLVADWWPLVFGLGAISLLVITPRRPVAAGLVGLVAATALLVSLELIGSVAVLWPMALIALGLALLVRPALLRRTPTGPSPIWTTADEVVAVWDDVEVHAPSSPAARNYTALFSDIRLDLRGVEPSPDARIRLTSVFGDVEVEVPGDWEVVIDGPRIFGVVRVDPAVVYHDAVVTPDSGRPRVRFDVVAVFGDIRVRRRVASAT